MVARITVQKRELELTAFRSYHDVIRQEEAKPAHVKVFCFFLIRNRDNNMTKPLPASNKP